jgi:nucleoside-triphosphatase
MSDRSPACEGPAALRSSPSVEPTRKIVLTGLPGSGKTTVVRRTADLLRKRAVKPWGFMTEEVSEDRSRTGFRVSTFDGVRIPFAHVLLQRGPRVGPYRVDVAAFEGTVLPILRAPQPHKGRRPRSLGVIDEVGRMECLSAAFCRRVEELLEANENLLITVAARGVGTIEKVRRFAGDHLIEVTPDNRDLLPRVLAETLLLYLGGP